MSKKSKPDASYQIRMPEDLLSRVSTAAERTGMSKNDMIKRSIMLGLPLALKALTLTAEQLTGLPDDVPESQPQPMQPAA